MTNYKYFNFDKSPWVSYECYFISGSTEVWELFTKCPHHDTSLFGIQVFEAALFGLKPEDFYRIAQLIKQKKHEREQQIQEMEDEITAALAEYHIPFEIKGRIKNIYSVYKKMMTREKDFEERQKTTSRQSDYTRRRQANLCQRIFPSRTEQKQRKSKRKVH